MASTVPWMSSGKKSSLVAQVWAQLAHVTVMIVMPFTTSVQPTCRHLGQLIRRWQSVLGIGGLGSQFRGRWLSWRAGNHQTEIGRGHGVPLCRIPPVELLTD
jgi:hypothetical protein